jgi:hypothetical protein
VSAHAAERQLLSAQHTAARRQAVRSAHARFAIQKTAEETALAAKYAEHRRHVLHLSDVNARAAAMHALAIEERAERETLSRSHAAMHRQVASMPLKVMAIAQRGERQHLVERQRRQRALFAVALRRRRPRAPVAGSLGHGQRVAKSRVWHLLVKDRRR